MASLLCGDSPDEDKPPMPARSRSCLRSSDQNDASQEQQHKAKSRPQTSETCSADKHSSGGQRASSLHGSPVKERHTSAARIQQSHAASASKERPCMAVCHLCGGEYGKASIEIHVRQCKKKVACTEACQVATPQRRQRPVPVELLPKTVPCPICQRNFGPTSIEVHVPQCKKKHEAAKAQRARVRCRTPLPAGTSNLVPAECHEERPASATTHKDAEGRDSLEWMQRPSPSEEVIASALSPSPRGQNVHRGSLDNTARQCARSDPQLESVGQARRSQLESPARSTARHSRSPARNTRQPLGSPRGTLGSSVRHSRLRPGSAPGKERHTTPSPECGRLTPALRQAVADFRSSKNSSSFLPPVAVQDCRLLGEDARCGDVDQLASDRSASPTLWNRNMIPLVSKVEELDQMKAVSTLAESSSKAMDWHESLVPCQHCGRTFFPDRLQVHLRSCRPVTPPKPSLKVSQSTSSLTSSPVKAAACGDKHRCGCSALPSLEKNADADIDYILQLQSTSCKRRLHCQEHMHCNM